MVVNGHEIHMAIDIGAMCKRGSRSYFINKETKAAYSTRRNHSKAFNYLMASDTERITKTDKSKLKNLISESVKPMSLTVPIGDGYHELFCLEHHHA